MLILVTYSEIRQYVREHFQQEIGIRIQLRNIEGIQEAFKYLTPENLFFSEDGVFLILALATP